MNETGPKDSGYGGSICDRVRRERSLDEQTGGAWHLQRFDRLARAFATRATQPASNTRPPNCSHNGSSTSPWTRKILTITTACATIRCSEPWREKAPSTAWNAPTEEVTRYKTISCDTAAIDRLLVDVFLEAHSVAPAQNCPQS